MGTVVRFVNIKNSPSLSSTMDLIRETDTEFNSFNRVLLQLIEYGLLSEIERRKIVFSDTKVERQAAIYQVILHKSQSQSSMIMEVLKYFHIHGYTNTDISSIRELDFKVDSLIDTNNSSTIDLYAKETNALLNNEVILNLFKYLKLEDILLCRTVCSKWNNVAEPIIRKRAKIKFGDLRPDAFLRMFSGYLPNIRFKAFMFTEETGKIDHDRKSKCLGNLVTFFRQWGKHIEELSWRPVNFFNFKGEKLAGGNITNFIVASENLSYLNVQGDSANKTVLNVEWKCLVRIKTVILKDCIVRIEQETKISPTKLYLENIEFFQNKVLLEQIRLNDFVNLSGVKVLNLKYIGMPNSSETRLILAFTGGSFNADSLTLDKISIEDWNEGANWKVDKLLIKEIPLIHKLRLKHKELVAMTTPFDLSCLNETCQTLRIIGCNKITFLLPQPANLPNLKQLCVDFSRKICPIFSDFMSSLKLDDIYFPCKHLTLNVDTIPTSVKAMKLSKSIKLIGERKICLDRLILDKYSLIHSAEALSKINAKIIVLQWIQNYENNDSVILFLKRHENVERALIGEFVWDNWKFEKCHLSEKVDKQSKYYEFKKGFGTSITSATFKNEMKLCTFQPTPL